MAANSLPMTLSHPLPLSLCHALHRLSCFSFRICISPLTLANRERVLALTHSDTPLIPLSPLLYLSLSVSVSLFASLSLFHIAHVSVCFRTLQFFRAWELPLFVSHLPFFKCLRHVHAKFKSLPLSFPLTLTPLSLTCSPAQRLGNGTIQR